MLIRLAFIVRSSASVFFTLLVCLYFFGVWVVFFPPYTFFAFCE
jgi:hypothetical protein